jgi:conjugal transfer pilus assembly protein TraK
VSNKLAKGTEAAGVWEKSLNYEEMLVELNKQLLNGQMPEGFIATKNFDYAPAGEAGQYFKLKPLNAWVGEELRVIKFVARNTSGQYLELDGSMFWSRGVRSVYVDRDVRNLGPGREATLMITLSDLQGER